ncbi:unnamed protein product [Mytilus edulis]|uniref:Uncharacterized protein n=1 Tax=Mytilus edulis TaxID=6550 RepID=A0A8S3SRV8_MYTED|nr:unnamed protein product [Mytilus edulis]
MDEFMSKMNGLENPSQSTPRLPSHHLSYDFMEESGYASGRPSSESELIDCDIRKLKEQLEQLESFKEPTEERLYPNLLDDKKIMYHQGNFLMAKLFPDEMDEFMSKMNGLENPSQSTPRLPSHRLSYDFMEESGYASGRPSSESELIDCDIRKLKEQLEQLESFKEPTEERLYPNLLDDKKDYVPSGGNCDLVTALFIAIMPGMANWNLQRDPNPAEQ